MKKFLNSDWLRAVQFLRNTVPKIKYSAKKEIQCKVLNFLNFFIFQIS